MSKNTFLLPFLMLLLGCSSSQKGNPKIIPDSSGNINAVTVVMPEKSWNGSLGEKVRTLFGSPYEGLPFDEPQFSLQYLNPKVFSGFARQSRNVLWFVKDSLGQFQLMQDAFARPQIVALVKGNDADEQAFYLEENAALIRQTLTENERIEKLRRIAKAPTTETNLENRFGISLVYPSAYETVKDTTNFIWIQKPITKGHLNVIAYTLPLNALQQPLNESILKIRDSIGKCYVLGRLPNSYMITEKAYLPYFYKTKLNKKEALLTKGTWEVQNDFMAGPFVNYMVKDIPKQRWMVVEGFTFAPSTSKRDYMFELNSILSTLKIN
jgi:hypothetical protein